MKKIIIDVSNVNENYLNFDYSKLKSRLSHYKLFKFDYDKIESIIFNSDVYFVFIQKENMILFTDLFYKEIYKENKKIISMIENQFKKSIKRMKK